MISLALDAMYALAAAATAPWWMRKSRGGWAERFGRVDPLAPPKAGRPRLLIHAVSVGEVNLTRPLIESLYGEAEVVLSVTTDTGIARARSVYEAGPCAGWARVVRYPLDASWSVRRFLDAIQPDGAALVELEVWPNFLRACRRRGIPVAVINGRLSARSFGRYRLARPFLGAYFRGLSFAAVQDEVYADRFRTMGVAGARIHVAGSMKWDAADTAEQVTGADALASELGIDRSRLLIVGGSTAPGEHELLHAATPPGVQLLCAPRKPEWCDQAASAMPGCVRRSDRAARSSDRFLLDTIGELRRAYALADVVVVGRSFGALYGSDPMEPSALGKPVIIGPAVSDFESAVRALLAARAIIQTDAQGLAREVADLIGNAQERTEMGNRARDCVIANQGAADRHAALIRENLFPSQQQQAADRGGQ